MPRRIQKSEFTVQVWERTKDGMYWVDKRWLRTEEEAIEYAQNNFPKNDRRVIEVRVVEVFKFRD